jgi:Flp pilus assembly protein TadG
MQLAMLARLRGDRGSVTVELVIAAPLLLVLLIGTVQFGLWSHAAHVAQAAASQGLAAARVQGGTAAEGQASAERLLAQLGHGPLTDIHIDVHRTADTASLRVDGVVSSVFPSLRLPVHAEAAGPVERFSAASGEKPSGGGGS